MMFLIILQKDEQVYSRGEFKFCTVVSEVLSLVDNTLSKLNED